MAPTIGNLHSTGAQAQDVGRRPISIWRLLVWTYRRQQAEQVLRQEGRVGRVWPEGFGRDSVERVRTASTLGFVEQGRVSVGSSGEGSGLPHDARVVARYVAALEEGARAAIIRAASDDAQPVRPLWPAAPALDPADWRRYPGGRLPRPQMHPTTRKPFLCRLAISPDPDPLLRQDQDYWLWWRALQMLDRVIGFEGWELQQWVISGEMPPAPLPVPAWAKGWADRA